MPATTTYEYLAHRFRPRTGSEQSLLLFVAPAAEIRGWAGVPRKAFDYQHGFQRTLNPTRVRDVTQFFQADARNVTPTAVVVGFTGSAGAVTVEPAPAAPALGHVGAEVETVRVRIVATNLDQVPLPDLTESAITTLTARLSETVIATIESDPETAISEALRLADEEAVDEAFGINAEAAVDDTALAAEARSYLADFYAQLRGYQRRLMPWPAEHEAEQQLREVLYSLLKPAIIVDGQHRVFGAALVDQRMLLPVCAVVDSTWAENVFQFVVINQKAKPIKPAFLSSIIATSLSTAEVDAVYGRLQTSRIDVERAREIDRVNADVESPFRDMIDFEVEGSPGFLQFPGMTRLTREFFGIPRTHAGLLPDGTWGSVTGSWMDHFFALWRGVRRYFETADARLWREPSEDNPNNLLKLVTLQEVQRLMLDNWADSRAFQLTTPTETERLAQNFWRDFPSTFFTDEWRKKGLQTSVGRGILREAMIETRRNIGRRAWGHRRLGLFSD